jgi:hypothetical protein
VTALALATSSDALAPVRATLHAMAAYPGQPPVAGISADLGVDDRPGWVPSTSVVSGEALDDLLLAAQERWHATPHAAAALAWKHYAYWLSLPAVLGYAVARRVPLLRPESVMAHWSRRAPFLMVGLTSVEVAVLPNDPLALAGQSAGVRVVPDEEALLSELRQSLMTDHLSPMLEEIKGRLHVGRRTLWGSLASGVAHGLSRAADVVPGPTLQTAQRVLSALGIDDLVELGTRADGHLAIHRKTCCLAFTLPQPKICSGCCIR